MKKIISKFRKCLCLILSIILLTSNMQVFGQERVQSDFVKENLDLIKKELDLIKDMYEFNKDLNGLKNILEEEVKLLIEDPISVLRDFHYGAKEDTFYPKSIENFMSKYKEVREKYYALSCSVDDILKKGALSELSYKYNGNLRLLSKSEKEMFDISTAFPPIKSIQYFENKINEMEYGIIKAYKAQGELVKQTFTPADVLEYTYKNGMLPKEKAGIKLTLEAMDADVSAPALVKSIRKYLNDFGTKIKDVKYSASLTKELKGMTLAERTKYVDELTELQSGSKAFISDFEKLDRPTKRYVGKSIIKGAWPLIIVGAVVTAAIITEIAADNNFNPAYTASIKDLSKIQEKIENGEASIQEQWLFYTDERNESLVQEDAVHTLNFVKLAQGAMEAEEILSKAEEENKAQKSKQVENSIMKNYQKQASKTDFGVGTL